MCTSRRWAPKLSLQKRIYFLMSTISVAIKNTEYWRTTLETQRMFRRQWKREFFSENITRAARWSNKENYTSFRSVHYSCQMEFYYCYDLAMDMFLLWFPACVSLLYMYTCTIQCGILDFELAAEAGRYFRVFRS